MNLLASWGTAIAFSGVVIVTCVKFHSFSPEQRRRYRMWFIASVVVIGLGTIMQLVAGYQ